LVKFISGRKARFFTFKEMHMIHDPQFCKLGRKAVKTDSRSIKLARYLTSKFTNPMKVSWTVGMPNNFGMMKNDLLGDCTCAGCGHAEQVFSSNTGNEITVTDSVILAAYEQWCGYSPADPSTDQGGVELDVLNSWKQNGLGGRKLDAFATVNFKSLHEVHRAISLFGGVYIGVGLPITAQNQTVWDVVPNSGADGEKNSWGGHCVFCPAYNQTDSTITCITWGSAKQMSNLFWDEYVDEAYCLIAADWFKSSGVDPTGLNLAQLMADVSQIQ